jgi:excisionase family DNA binding protein
MTRPSNENDASVPEPEQFDPDIMTVDEAAAFLRVGRSQLYDAIGRFEVPHRRVGRSIRLSRAALVKWLENTAS